MAAPRTLAKLSVVLGVDSKKATAAVGLFSSMFSSNVMKLMKIAGVAAPVVASFYAAFKGTQWAAEKISAITQVGGAFESEMQRMAAVTQGASQNMDAMFEAAKKSGIETAFTATESAQALKFLGMAGFNASQAMQALGATTDLATIGNTDLAKSADIVTNVMTSYGMNAEQVGYVNDVLVGTFTNANTNLLELAEAFKYAAPIAHSAGIPFQQTAAAMGLLADAGIKGSMSGTNFARSIAMLMKPTAKVKILIKKLGLEFFDAEGNIKDYVGILRELEAKNVSTADTLKIFGMIGGRAVLNLVGKSDELENFSILVGKSGTAAATAAKIMDTWWGSTKELASAWEGLKISMSGAGEEATGFLDVVRPLVDWTTQNIRALSRWIDESEEFQMIIKALQRAVNDWMTEFNVAFAAIGNVWKESGADLRTKMIATIKEIAGAVTNVFLDVWSAMIRELVAWTVATLLDPMTWVGLAQTIGDTILSGIAGIYSGLQGAGRAIAGAADGGILKGPKGGYLAELHGKEAVVPLDKGDPLVEFLKIMGADIPKFQDGGVFSPGGTGENAFDTLKEFAKLAPTIAGTYRDPQLVQQVGMLSADEFNDLLSQMKAETKDSRELAFIQKALFQSWHKSQAEYRQFAKRQNQYAREQEIAAIKAHAADMKASDEQIKAVKEEAKSNLELTRALAKSVKELEGPLAESVKAAYEEFAADPERQLAAMKAQAMDPEFQRLFKEMPQELREGIIEGMREERERLEDLIAAGGPEDEGPIEAEPLNELELLKELGFEDALAKMAQEQGTTVENLIKQGSEGLSKMAQESNEQIRDNANQGMADLMEAERQWAEEEAALASEVAEQAFAPAAEGLIGAGVQLSASSASLADFLRDDLPSYFRRGDEREALGADTMAMLVESIGGPAEDYFGQMINDMTDKTERAVVLGLQSLSAEAAGMAGMFSENISRASIAFRDEALQGFIEGTNNAEFVLMGMSEEMKAAVLAMREESLARNQATRSYVREAEQVATSMSGLSDELANAPVNFGVSGGGNVPVIENRIELNGQVLYSSMSQIGAQGVNSGSFGATFLG